MKNIDDYLMLVCLGMIDLGVTEEKGQLYFSISVPEEIEERILPAWKEIRWENLEREDLSIYLSQDTKKKVYSVKELQREFDVFFDRMMLITYFYGLVEAEEFRQIFGKVFQTDLSLDELMHFVYLKGTFHRELRTGSNRMTGESYIGMAGLI